MRILVTGAAGLIGGALVTRLAGLGHTVSALVRNSRPRDRPDGVVWIEGDVRLPMLGAEAVARRGLDAVVHCAAVTGFGLPDAAYQAVNVDGTARAIEFARAANARLLYVSTAYVCGTRDGVITEGERDCGQSFTNGYEASKAQAEALVAATQGAIARPSIVTGAWLDGSIAYFSGVYTLFGLIGSGRIAVYSAAPGAAIDLVPIDHVVDGLVDITERIEAAAGRVFHLVSGDPVPIATLHGIATEHPRLRPSRLMRSGEGPAPAAGPAMRLYASYFTRAPRFEARNLPQLSGRVCPPVDAAYLGRMIDFAVGAGVLGNSRTSG